MFVIGTGPAGQRAAVQAAKLGKRVAICDRREVVGGTCINTGTIPSKTFREAALSFSGLHLRNFYGAGFVAKENLSMADLVLRCRKVMTTEIEVVRHQLRRNRIEVFEGEASFLDPHRVVVKGPAGTAAIAADFMVIANGTEPARPEQMCFDGKTIFTSEDILTMPELPKTMTIIGAGVIGIEYASIFAALGVKVTVIDAQRRILDFLDEEVVSALIYQMRAMGAIFRLGEEVAAVDMLGEGGAVAQLRSGKTVSSDVLLCSVGRQGATGSLQLEAAGLRADARGRVAVNGHYQTAAPHIYAAGDVVGFPSLASTSMEQGRIAACHAFGAPYRTMRHLFPYGIYAIPEISLVGRTEAELTAQGINYEVGVARYREIARGNILGDDSGFLKLLFHRETRRILGVHIMGTGAAELIHIGQTTMAFEGTLDYFVENVFNYPTFAECYKVAALDGFNKVGPLPSDGLPIEMPSLPAKARC